MQKLNRPTSDQNPISSVATSTDLGNALNALGHLDLSSLQMRWRELHGRTAPARLGADLLRRAIAHRLQEEALGGLSRAALLRLKAAHFQAGKNGAASATSPPAMVRPGTRFLREWQGEVHEVQAIDAGDFVYRGKTYRSLSVIARNITGTHQSGPRFFGLGRKASKVQAQEIGDG